MNYLAQQMLVFYFYLGAFTVYGLGDKIKTVRPVLENTSSLFSNPYRMQ